LWNNSTLKGWTVRLLYDDTVSNSPDFEMDLLNFLDLRRGTLKGGKGGSLLMNRCHEGTKDSFII